MQKLGGKHLDQGHLPPPIRPPKKSKVVPFPVAVSGLVSGPFAIYNSPHGRGFVLIHLPSQAKILGLDMQNACKDAAERFAALDLNWWTCIPQGDSTL